MEKGPLEAVGAPAESQRSWAYESTSTGTRCWRIFPCALISVSISASSVCAHRHALCARAARALLERGHMHLLA